MYTHVPVTVSACCEDVRFSEKKFHHLIRIRPLTGCSSTQGHSSQTPTTLLPSQGLAKQKTESNCNWNWWLRLEKRLVLMFVHRWRSGDSPVTRGGGGGGGGGGGALEPSPPGSATGSLTSYLLYNSVTVDPPPPPLPLDPPLEVQFNI